MEYVDCGLGVSSNFSKILVLFRDFRRVERFNCFKGLMLMGMGLWMLELFGYLSFWLLEKYGVCLVKVN